MVVEERADELKIELKSLWEDYGRLEVLGASDSYLLPLVRLLVDLSLIL